MAKRNIHITDFDKKRLEELIAVADEFGGRDRQDLSSLAAELARAKVVPSRKVPPDVVTMNSEGVLREVDTAEEMTSVVGFPRDADVDAGAISVLAPVGTAILGYSKGDMVEWPVPSGVRRLRIENILYQPEASGDFDR